MKERKFYWETIIYFLGTVFVSCLGFIISLLYSKLFIPSDYGTYSLVAGAYGLISSVYGGWIGQSIIRSYQAYREKGQINQFKSSIYWGHILMSSLFFVFSLIFAKYSKLDKLYSGLIIIMGAVYFFEYFILITNTFLRAEGKAKQYSFNVTINNFLKIVMLLFLYYVLKFRSIIVIGGSLLLAEAIQTLYLLIKYNVYKNLCGFSFNYSIFRKLFLFGFPLMGVAITSWVLNVSDRFIIKLFYSENEVGLYSYAYTLATSIFNLLVQFIMLGAFPNIVAAWENGGKKKACSVIQGYLKIYFIVLTPAIFGVLAVAQDLFNVLTDEKYHSCYPIFIVTAIGTVILGLTQYTNKAWELTNKTKVVLGLNVLSAILNVILNVILVPVVGYSVAAWTTNISYLLYLIISIVISRKILPISMDKIFIIKIFVSSVIMLVAIKICNYYIIDQSIINLFFKVLIGMIIYLIMLLLTKIISLKEILHKKIEGKTNEKNQFK